jgi:hypothetical protein
MKVIFKKKHREGINTFQKGDVAVVHHTLGAKLLKKGVVEETNIITEEDKVLKQLRDEHNG